MTRSLGTALALASHLLLGVTVCYLFPFLMGTEAPNAVLPPGARWWLDGLLVVQFGLAHSVLLLPPVRGRLERVIPGPLYGCFFTLTTCLSLLLLVLAWQRSSLVVWRFSDG